MKLLISIIFVSAFLGAIAGYYLAYYFFTIVHNNKAK